MIPSWDDYFMGLAFAVSQRSPDPSTKHGCILVDRENKIIGCGYNGYAKGVPHNKMPTTRPDKYDWTLHSEENAICNAVINLKNLKVKKRWYSFIWKWLRKKPPIIGGGKAYITGYPCIHCALLLWQNNITEWICADRRGYSNPPDNQTSNVEKLCKETGVSLIVKNFKIDWLRNIKI